MTTSGEWGGATAAAYDEVAEAYAEKFLDELDRKPFDRALLERFAAAARGRVCDIGCGPGHITRYLRDRGVDAFGLDLSTQMVGVARRLNPDIAFEQGDMLGLPFDDKSLGAIVAFYSIIHVTRPDVPRALGEMRRVLVDGGTLLVAVHGGDGEAHTDEFLGRPVSVDATLFTRDEVERLFSDAGFTIVESASREPYEFERTERIYLWGRTAPS